MIKLYLSAVILLFALTASVRSQSIYRKSDINPEYLKYLHVKSSGHLKILTPRGHRLDYVPSPLKLTFKNAAGSGMLKGETAFPGRFDLRDSALVTPVKNQGGGEFGGNCVAFATMGSLESSWLKMGDMAYDLSEQNMAACYGFEWAFGDGATASMPGAYLTRFSGPVLELQHPYNLNNPSCISSFDPVYYIPEVRWLPDDAELIKRLVMSFGALVVSVHIDYDKFDDETDTYYYDGDDPANHAFLLCGWDDQKVTAGGNGAWIIKNSWGEGWAEDGFVYVSYNDTKILDDVTFYPCRWDTDEADYLYYYDELGAIYSLGWATTATTYDYAQGLVKFRASSNQLVTRIGTYVLSQGAILDIEVFKSFDGKFLSDPIASLENIYIEYPGYYTFSIPFEVSGDFYIKLRYFTPGNDAPIPVEGYQKSGGEEWADPVLEQNVCWYGIDDTTWTLMDTLSEPANLCIRAYAKNRNKVSASVVSGKTISCLNSGVEFSAVTTGAPDSFQWNFGEGAVPATASGEGPHTVSYGTTGTKHVRLICSGGGGTDTTILYNAVEIVDRIRVHVEQDTIITPSRLNVTLKAFGADTYSWAPVDNLDKTEGSTVILNAKETGTLSYTVTGTQGDCVAEKTVTVISRPRPANDDVCEALYVEPGGWIGKFTNTDATVEAGEPAPESGPGGCTKPMMWCTEAEGKLQHTVWFWFYGPETNLVSIDAKGFDNQIAIWKADTCTDILEGKAILVAAYDDYYDADLENAAAIESALAIEGEKYFLQVDGSFGGQEGEFDLVFMAYPLGEEDIFNKDYDRLSVYPNPNLGTFSLHIRDRISRSVAVEIYNNSGQLLMRESCQDEGTEFKRTYDLSMHPAGIYHMRVITGGSVNYKKIVKR